MNTEEENHYKAVGWAVWTVLNTDMGLNRIITRANEKFGVQKAPLRRQIAREVGEDYLTKRAERMKKEGMKYAPADVKDKMKRSAKMHKEISQADQHVRDIWIQE